jgi:hypothetical protein
MKRYLLVCTALIAVTITVYGKDVWAPDHHYAIRAESAISLVDQAGNQIFVLAPQTKQDLRVEVAWSPDSKHVLVLENYQRGSVITGAWFDGSSWHKTIEDASIDKFIELQSRQLKQRVQSEHEQFAGWISPSEMAVQGVASFSGSHTINYRYNLIFEPDAFVHLDRGGYEEGQLVGKDYRVF